MYRRGQRRNEKDLVQDPLDQDTKGPFFRFQAVNLLARLNPYYHHNTQAHHTRSNLTPTLSGLSDVAFDPFK